PREHALVEAAPIAAVDEDEEAARVLRGKDVHAMARILAVGYVDVAAQRRAHERGILLPACEERRMLRHQGSIVVLALDELGIHAAMINSRDLGHRPRHR